MQSAIDPRALPVNDADSIAAPSDEPALKADQPAEIIPPAADPRQEDWSRVGFAVIVGLIVGLIGNALFFGSSIGINFPLFVAVCVGAALLALRAARQPIQRNNLFLLAPLAFFALMVAIRADTLITMLNGMAVITLGALFVYYAPLRRTFDVESFGQQVSASIETALTTTFAPLLEMNTFIKWMRAVRFGGSARVRAILRGALLTLPILVIFAVLLASADAIFDQWLAQLSRLINIRLDNTLMAQGALIAFLGWFAAGALIFTTTRRSPVDVEDSPHSFSPHPPTPSPLHGEGESTAYVPPLHCVERGLGGEVRKTVKSRPLTLGMIESGMILGSLNALFGMFVVIQFAYFFGGRDAILAQGLTYAQYARRGFFELVAVAALTIGLALFLDWTTIRQNKRESRAFQALIVVMVALNLVMLASASQRMWLYEEAFGFTQLRVYVHVAIAWMSALFVGLLGSLFRIRRHIFSLAIFVTVIGYGASLNLMNVDLYIAERNIARTASTDQLDLVYLWSMSVDATPAFIDLFQTTTDAETRDFAGQWLIQQLTRIERASEGATIFSAHSGRGSAGAQIAAIRATLPPVNWRYYPPSDNYTSWDMDAAPARVDMTTAPRPMPTATRIP
jgi:hypothetical protein